MKILALAPDQSNKYNFGHQLFRDEIARQHEVVFFGFRYPPYTKDPEFSVPKLFDRYGDFDVVLVEGPKHAGYFTDLDKVDAIKASILVDYCPPYLDRYHGFIKRMNLDVVFLVCPASMQYFSKMQRRGHIAKSVIPKLLHFSVDTGVFKKLGDLKKKQDVMAVFSTTPWCYGNRRLIFRMVQKLTKEGKITSIVGGNSPNNRVLHGDYVKAINQSRVFLTANNIYNVMSMKYYECLACGTFMLADKPDGFKEQGFVDGEHLVLYDGMDDLKGKIFYYLEHESEREKIAEQGMKFVRKKHTTEIRVKEMIGAISENFGIST